MPPFSTALSLEPVSDVDQRHQPFRWWWAGFVVVAVVIPVVIVRHFQNDVEPVDERQLEEEKSVVDVDEAVVVDRERPALAQADDRLPITWRRLDSHLVE
jgi:hypothetical protein